MYKSSRGMFQELSKEVTSKNSGQQAGTGRRRFFTVLPFEFCSHIYQPKTNFTKKK